MAPEVESYLAQGGRIHTVKGKSRNSSPRLMQTASNNISSFQIVASISIGTTRAPLDSPKGKPETRPQPLACANHLPSGSSPHQITKRASNQQAPSRNRSISRSRTRPLTTSPSNPPNGDQNRTWIYVQAFAQYCCAMWYWNTAFVAHLIAGLAHQCGSFRHISVLSRSVPRCDVRNAPTYQSKSRRFPQFLPDRADQAAPGAIGRTPRRYRSGHGSHPLTKPLKTGTCGVIGHRVGGLAGGRPISAPENLVKKGASA